MTCPSDNDTTVVSPAEDIRSLAELLAERDRLLALKQSNNEILTQCRAQISSAQAKVISEGKYSDPDWFAAVNTRARYAGRQDQEFARQLGELRRQIVVANKRENFRAPTPSPDAVAGSGTDHILALLVSGIQDIQRAIDLLRCTP